MSESVKATQSKPASGVDTTKTNTTLSFLFEQAVKDAIGNANHLRRHPRVASAIKEAQVEMAYLQHEISMGPYYFQSRNISACNALISTTNTQLKQLVVEVQEEEKTSRAKTKPKGKPQAKK